jgi:N-acetylornithine carbamoyltransferase
MQNFYDLSEYSLEELEELLALANRLEDKPEPKSLNGKVLALLFLSPSLRTLSSFQAAMTRLGGGTFVISPEMSIHGLESRSGIIMDGVAAEHIREAVPVIASYADAIGIRAFAKRNNLNDDLLDKRYKELTSLVENIPSINMESAIHHPCQGLGDWKTLNDYKIPKQGGKIVLSWTNHPQPLPYSVPATTLESCVTRGMDVTILRPDGFELPAQLMNKAANLAKLNGGSIYETSNRIEAMEDAHIIYATSWSSVQNYGNANDEDRLKRQLNFYDWCVNDSWFDNADKNCKFMHSLPIRRGVTAEDEVLDNGRSIVINEARNRMLVQMAVLHQMLV